MEGLVGWLVEVLQVGLEDTAMTWWLSGQTSTDARSVMPS
jgi:hypothetical protein